MSWSTSKPHTPVGRDIRQRTYLLRGAQAWSGSPVRAPVVRSGVHTCAGLGSRLTSGSPSLLRPQLTGPLRCPRSHRGHLGQTVTCATSGSGSSARTATEPRSGSTPKGRTSQLGSGQTMEQAAPARPGTSTGRPLSEDIIPLTLTQRSLQCPVTGPVLDGLHSGVGLNAAASTDGAAVLSLNTGSGPASFLDVNLGKLAAGRMLACARSKLWWMTPEWTNSTQSLPPEIQFLLVELRPGGAGPYALLLPLIDGDFRATLRPAFLKGGEEGDIVLRVESGDENVAQEMWKSVLHVSVGWDPYTLVDRGVAAAAALSGGAAPLSEKQLPPSLDVFGWCTWDAFYSSVSARGIQEGLTSLQEDGIRPRFLIIDDGWQMTDLDPPGKGDTPRAPSSPAELADSIDWIPEEERELIRGTQDEFWQESMEVLAETAVTLPAGTSAATSMPMLSNLGPEGARAAHQSHHAHPSMDSPPVAPSEDAGSSPQPAGPAGSSNASAGPLPISAKLPAGLRLRKPLAGAKPGAGKDSAGATTKEQQGQQGAAATTSGSAGSEARGEARPPEGLALLMTRLGQKVAGWAVGLGTAAFLLGYQWLVEPAPPGSLPVRTFAALANGPLRGAMLGFYSGASDFTRRLTSVKANAKFSSPDAGPDEPWTGKAENLKDVVRHLKAQFGLQYVYCWHGLPGYWAGIMPDAPEMAHLGINVIYARPTPGVLEVEPSMAWNPAVLAGVGVAMDPSPIYNSMHAYLASSGVDGVKVDCQAGVGLVGSAAGGGPALSRRFHAALESSIADHFTHNHAINCMCHSTENLYRMHKTAVARASDDFYPRDPASSQPHIAACAYNSMFLSALVQPDWDMFHSKHPAAVLHAIARAISGGGVYVSDKPAEHDTALLRKLVLADGSLLRCAGAGRPTRDTLFNDVLRDGRSALKVWNFNRGGPGAPSTALPLSGVVAVFNLQGSSWDRNKRKFFVHEPKPAAVTTHVVPKDVEALAQLPGGAATRFVAHVHGAPSSALRVVEWTTALPVRLGAATGEMITFAPVSQCGEVGFAVVGLSNMFNSGGAVTSVTSGASTASVGVRGAGTLLMYASVRPRAVKVCGLSLLFEYRAANGALEVEVPPTTDLTAVVSLEW